MLDVRYSHLYFYQSLNRLQRGLSAIAELLVSGITGKTLVPVLALNRSVKCSSRPNAGAEKG